MAGGQRCWGRTRWQHRSATAGLGTGTASVGRPHQGGGLAQTLLTMAGAEKWVHALVLSTFLVLSTLPAESSTPVSAATAARSHFEPARREGDGPHPSFPCLPWVRQGQTRARPRASAMGSARKRGGEAEQSRAARRGGAGGPAQTYMLIPHQGAAEILLGIGVPWGPLAAAAHCGGRVAPLPAPARAARPARCRQGRANLLPLTASRSPRLLQRHRCQSGRRGRRAGCSELLCIAAGCVRGERGFFQL